MYLTTSVIPDDIEQPNPATIARKSGQVCSYHCRREREESFTCPEHALIDVVVRSNTINSKDKKRHGEQESKHNADGLLARSQYQSALEKIYIRTFNSENFVRRTMVLISTPSDL